MRVRESTLEYSKVRFHESGPAAVRRWDGPPSGGTMTALSLTLGGARSATRRYARGKHQRSGHAKRGRTALRLILINSCCRRLGIRRLGGSGGEGRKPSHPGGSLEETTSQNRPTRDFVRFSSFVFERVQESSREFKRVQESSREFERVRESSRELCESV